LNEVTGAPISVVVAAFVEAGKDSMVDRAFEILRHDLPFRRPEMAGVPHWKTIQHAFVMQATAIDDRTADCDGLKSTLDELPKRQREPLSRPTSNN
jgi:hypothetical protein